jgi:hypothetical protein
MEQINNPIFNAVLSAINAHINSLIDAKIAEYSRQVSESIGQLTSDDFIKQRVAEILNATDTVSLISDAHKDALKEMIDASVAHMMDVHTNDFEHNSEHDIERIAERAVENVDIDDKISSAFNDHDFTYEIEKAVESIDFDDAINDAVENLDLSEMIGTYLEENDYPDEAKVKEIMANATPN